MRRGLKLFCLILCLAVLVSTVAACQKTEAPKDAPKETAKAAGNQPWQSATEGSGGIALPVFKEKEKFQFMLYEVAANPYKDGFIVVPELGRRVNADIELLPTPVDGFPEKINIMLMSGDYPDIIAGIDFPVIVEQGLEGGKFLNIMDYLDYMPNFKALLAKVPELNNYKAGPDSMYSLPLSIYSEKYPKSLLMYTFLTRKDIVEKHGLTLPTTYDELYDFLKRLKELYPDSEPWTDRTGVTGLIEKVATSWGMNNSFGKFNYDANARKFSLALDDPKYKEVMLYLHKLYEEGLIDQEFILMSTDQWMAKMVNGTSFFACDWFSRAQVLTEAARQTGNSEYLMTVIDSPAGPGGRQVVKSGNLVRTFMAVSSKVKDPVGTLQMLDYFLYSKDGSVLNQLGIEGTTFKWADEAKTKYEYIPFGTVTDKSDYRPYQLEYGVCMDLTSAVRVEEFALSQAISEEDIYNYNSLAGKTVMPPPTLVYNTKEKERLNELGSFDTFVDAALAEFIVGDRDMSTWDEFVKEAGDTYGGHAQADVMNESWARRLTGE